MNDRAIQIRSENISKDQYNHLVNSENDSQWYCSKCKAYCYLCNVIVKDNDPAVRCDNCNNWVHNKCSGIHANEYIELQVQTTSATWICPTCDIMNFSDSFFENTSVINIENKFSLLENHQNNPRNKVTFQHETTKQRIIKGKMKLMSININGIRGKKTPAILFP